MRVYGSGALQWLLVCVAACTSCCILYGLGVEGKSVLQPICNGQGFQVATFPFCDRGSFLADSVRNTSTPCHPGELLSGNLYQLSLTAPGTLKISVTANFECRAEIATPACQCRVSWNCSGTQSLVVRENDLVDLVIAQYSQEDYGFFEVNVALTGDTPTSHATCGNAELISGNNVIIEGTLVSGLPLLPDQCAKTDSRSGYYYRFRTSSIGVLQVTLWCDYLCYAEVLTPDCECDVGFRPKTLTYPIPEVGTEFVFLISTLDGISTGNYQWNLSVIPANETGCDRSTAVNLTVPAVITHVLEIKDQLLPTPCFGYQYADYYRIVGTGDLLSFTLTSNFFSRGMLTTSDCTCMAYWNRDEPASYQTTPGEELYLVVGQYALTDWGQYTISIDVETTPNFTTCSTPKRLALPFTVTEEMGPLTNATISSCFDDLVRTHFFSFKGDGSLIYIYFLSDYTVKIGLYTTLCGCMNTWNPQDYGELYSFQSLDGFQYIIGVTQTYELEAGAYSLAVESQQSAFYNVLCETAEFKNLPFVVSSTIMPDIYQIESHCTSNLVSGKFYQVLKETDSVFFFSFAVVSDFDCYIEIYRDDCTCWNYFPCNDEPHDTYCLPDQVCIVGVLQKEPINYGYYTLTVVEKISLPSNNVFSDAQLVFIPYTATNYLKNNNQGVAGSLFLPTPCSSSRFANFFKFVGDGDCIELVSIGKTFTCLIELSTENGTCIDVWPCGQEKRFTPTVNVTYVVVVAQNCTLDASETWLYTVSITKTCPDATWKKWVIGFCIGVPGLVLGLIGLFYLYVQVVTIRNRRALRKALRPPAAL
ncbi:hypothetical protein Pelo_1822 [Pelomyxa schiedti]|nr:hypothetical protein Pelo_1822 [Pelomyxa schiedti]